MCGIGGIAGGADAAATRAALDAMTAAMHHRGPDDRGAEVVTVDGSVVGLCATRLAIQDCSPRGHQPMRSERTGNWVAFNGELYNVADLRDELRGLGHAFGGHSDTEVVLRSYDEWGEECLARLRGMFGLALWDERRRRLLLARDRLGIKPLYMARRGTALVFASELRAVLATGLVERRLSDAGLRSYLASGAIEEPLTIIHGIEALAPGSYATWEQGRVSHHEYWSLAAAFTDGDPSPRSRADVVAELRELLEDAARRHLVSDVPLGVFLSGGIDSSAVAALVTKVADEPPMTVSVVFPNHELSEERYIRMVSEALETRHMQVEMDDRSFLAELFNAVESMDQPTFDGVNTYVVSKAARESGLTVALSGLGGDELFAGYDTFRNVPRLTALRSRTPRAVSRPAGSLVKAFARSDRGQKLARWLAESGDDVSAYELQRELFPAETRERLVPGASASRGVSASPVQPLDPVNEVSYLELTHYMRNVLLRDADVMSMAHSLEVRVPLLDHRVVEYVAGLPGERKIEAARPKALLVESVGDLLPAEAIDRPKMGFTFPFGDWMRNGLRKDIEGRLLDDSYGGGLSGALDAGAIDEVWQRYLAGHGYWTRPWSLFVLKVWAERHLASA